jgi:diguanylate cyclase (GGDEF)-like protein
MSEGEAAAHELADLRDEVARLTAQNEKLRASNRRWMRIAGTDELTGLPNRVFFTTALLTQQISRSNVEGTPFTCLIMAPDQIGEINQRFGREGGDEVVKGIARFLKEQLKEGERLVHFDGANFVVMIPGAGPQQAKQRALAMRARLVSRPIEVADQGVNLTMSMGSASRSPSDAQVAVDTTGVIETLIRKLTARLDEAKRGGRDKLEQDLDTEF